MKYINYKIKLVLGVLTLILAGSIAMNANAKISEKCKNGFVPLQKMLMLKTSSNTVIGALLEYAKSQCGAMTQIQGKGGANDI
jgi:hypothetical protein